MAQPTEQIVIKDDAGKVHAYIPTPELRARIEKCKYNKKGEMWGISIFPTYLERGGNLMVSCKRPEDRRTQIHNYHSCISCQYLPE